MLSRITRVERGRETGGITKYTGEQKEQGVFLESLQMVVSGFRASAAQI